MSICWKVKQPALNADPKTIDDSSKLESPAQHISSLVSPVCDGRQRLESDWYILLTTPDKNRYTKYTVFTFGFLCGTNNTVTSHNENRIWFLYAKALEAKTPEDTNHAVQELRTELDEQSFISKRLVEAQINNLAFLDAPATIIRGQTAAQQTRPGYPKTLTQSKQAL